MVNIYMGKHLGNFQTHPAPNLDSYQPGNNCKAEKPIVWHNLIESTF